MSTQPPSSGEARRSHAQPSRFLITGGLTGIGRAAAARLAKKGAKVVLPVGVTRQAARLVEELHSLGFGRRSSSRPMSGRRMTSDPRRQDRRTVAGPRVASLNNAGTEGQVGPITDRPGKATPPRSIRTSSASILSMKHEVASCPKQGSGSIFREHLLEPYGHEVRRGLRSCRQQHAVEVITKSVALETARSGIRVGTGVAPGPTDTGMLTRFTGTAENKAALARCSDGPPRSHEELANAIVFIASDEASVHHGHVLNVDGVTPQTDSCRARGCFCARSRGGVGSRSIARGSPP